MCQQKPARENVLSGRGPEQEGLQGRLMVLVWMVLQRGTCQRIVGKGHTHTHTHAHTLFLRKNLEKKTVARDFLLSQGSTLCQTCLLQQSVTQVSLN